MFAIVHKMNMDPPIVRAQAMAFALVNEGLVFEQL